MSKQKRIKDLFAMGDSSNPPHSPKRPKATETTSDKLPLAAEKQVSDSTTSNEPKRSRTFRSDWASKYQWCTFDKDNKLFICFCSYEIPDMI